MEAKLPKWAASTDGREVPHAVIRRPLRRQGVNEMSPLQWPGPVGVAVIEPRSLGMFEFTDIGKRVFVQPVLCGPQLSDLVDIIAWNPRDPSRIWTRT